MKLTNCPVCNNVLNIENVACPACRDLIKIRNPIGFLNALSDTDLKTLFALVAARAKIQDVGHLLHCNRFAAAGLSASLRKNMRDTALVFKQAGDKDAEIFLSMCDGADKLEDKKSD